MMKAATSLLLMLVIVGCCPTYEYRLYEHAPTAHLKTRIEASSFDGSLKDYAVGEVLFSPVFRGDDNLDGTKSRGASIQLFSKESTEIHVEKVVIETEDGKRVTYKPDETLKIERNVYQKPFFTAHVRLHNDRTKKKSRASEGDLIELWGAKKLKLFIWARPPSKNKTKKLDFDLKLDTKTDIAWPT